MPEHGTTVMVTERAGRAVPFLDAFKGACSAHLNDCAPTVFDHRFLLVRHDHQRDLAFSERHVKRGGGCTAQLQRATLWCRVVGNVGGRVEGVGHWSTPALRVSDGALTL